MSKIVVNLPTSPSQSAEEIAAFHNALDAALTPGPGPHEIEIHASGSTRKITAQPAPAEN